MGPLTILFARLRLLRFRALAPLLLLALARLVYQQRRRHLAPLRVHRAIVAELAHEQHQVGDSSSTSESARALLNPVEEWVDVGDGVLTQSLVYHAVPDGDTQSDVLVLLLPGNPGIAHFYLPLMRELVQRHGRRHEVRCLSNAGHFMPHRNGDREFSFQEQIAHKCAYVRQRVAANPTLRLVIICHSIGAYVTLRVAEAFPAHIAKLCLMQPTITHIGGTAKGTALMPLFRHRQLSVRLIHLLEFLFPLAVRRWVIKLAIGAENERVLQQAALSLVERNVMRNVLLMAFHEMLHVRELDDALVRAHEDKTLFVYSPVDAWVPTEFAQGYQLRFTKARHRVVPQSHGFMMDKHGTRDMAAHISQWIGDVLDAGAESDSSRRA
ncbi:hypothetical protein PybrP1_009505 [[Pythium] brassicae (nom. inval.)]|nr:hypothetical protein PybrP1_009505 [[Pythium] brassicae (nom. inval.)]